MSSTIPAAAETPLDSGEDHHNNDDDDEDEEYDYASFDDDDNHDEEDEAKSEHSTITSQEDRSHNHRTTPTTTTATTERLLEELQHLKHDIRYWEEQVEFWRLRYQREHELVASLQMRYEREHELVTKLRRRLKRANISTLVVETPTKTTPGQQQQQHTRKRQNGDNGDDDDVDDELEEKASRNRHAFNTGKLRKISTATATATATGHATVGESDTSTTMDATTTTTTTTTTAVVQKQKLQGVVVGKEHAMTLTTPPPPALTYKFLWHYHPLDGKVRRVPPGWRIPRGSLLVAYQHYHLGDETAKIAPSKLYSWDDVKYVKRGRRSLYEFKITMAVLDKRATRFGIIKPTMTKKDVMVAYSAGIAALNLSDSTETGRKRMSLERMSWHSVFKQIPTEVKREASAFLKLHEKDMTDIVIGMKADNGITTEGAAAAADKNNGDTAAQSNCQNLKYLRHYYPDDRKFRRVPPGWCFPKGTVESVYMYYHLGNEEQKAAPIKLLSPDDVKYVKRGRRNLYDLKSMLSIIDKKAQQLGLLKPSMTEADVRMAYQVSGDALCISSVTDQGRKRCPEKISWHSAFKLIPKEIRKEGMEILNDNNSDK